MVKKKNETMDRMEGDLKKTVQTSNLKGFEIQSERERGPTMR
jgi:hypothetical protein